MAFAHSPKIVTDGLVLALDAGNPKSYPGSGTVWRDKSGNGNDGTLTNGPTFSSDNGGSIVFDGANDYVDCGNTSITNITSSNFTLETVFLSDDVSVYGQTLLSKAENGGYGLELNVTETSLAVSIHINGSYRVVGYPTSNLQSNTIYHVASTYNNSEIVLYVNGIFIDSLSVTGNVKATSVPMCIGNNPSGGGGGNNELGGKIYTARIYNRALSASEVQQNYNALKGRFGL